MQKLARKVGKDLWDGKWANTFEIKKEMCLFVKRKYDIGTAQIHLLLKENMKIRGLVKRFQQIVVDLAGNKDNRKADYVSRPAAKSRQIIYKCMNIFLCLCYLWLQCQCTSGPKMAQIFMHRVGLFPILEWSLFWCKPNSSAFCTLGIECYWIQIWWTGFAQPTQKTFISSNRSSLC